VTAGLVLQGIAMCVTGPAATPRTVPTVPWALILAISVVGIAVTLGGIRRQVIAGTTVLVNLAWLAVWAPSLLGFAHGTATLATANAFLTGEAVIGAALSAGLWPFHRRISVVPASSLIPTAQALRADTAATPNRKCTCLFAPAGIPTRRHAEPFQCRICGVSSPLSHLLQPTAQMLRADTAATPNSGPASFGLAARRHTRPFQCSISVFCEPRPFP
jgi:hypothetical protein